MGCMFCECKPGEGCKITAVPPPPPVKLVVDNTKAADNPDITKQPTVWFDLDGVLANFDKEAERVLGTNNIYRFEFVHGQDLFWKLLDSEPNFFRRMEMMPGAHHMLRAAGVWKRDVRILTALPKTNPENVDAQKRYWVNENIGSHVPVVTCLTKDKPNYCKPGDILIDDRAVNKRRWKEKGGKFILHENVGNTLAQLEALGVAA